MSNLTSQDINQLIEALLVWEREPTSQGFQMSLLTGIFTASRPENAADYGVKIKSKIDNIMGTAEQESQLRREQSVMLQAKLLAMRNDILKEEFPTHATNH